MSIQQALALLDAAAPGLGARRLALVDGPAGSGKTTFAHALRRALASDPWRAEAELIHLDDLLAGWQDSLPRVIDALVDGVLEPLAQDEPATYRRWDWHTSRWGDWVPVPAAPVLIVEGVGAGSRAAAAHASLLIWCEASVAIRKRRALERDGDTFAPHWSDWADREASLFATEQTRERADLVVPT